MNINDLPPELLVNFFNYSTQEDVLTVVSNVCENWNQLSQSASIWQHVDLNRLAIKKFMTLDMIPKISNIMTHIHVLKASPARMEELLNLTSKNLTSLKYLELTPTCVSDREFVTLIQTRCPNLQTIQIGFTYDTIEVLNAVLSSLTVDNIHLYHKELKRNRNSTSVFVAKIADLLEKTEHHIKQFKSIMLESSSPDFLEPFLELTKNNISVLNAFGRFITDKTLSRISNAVNLTELRLDFSRISNQCLNSIADNNPGLKVLSLQCCKQITDKGLRQVTKSCKKLEQLFVRNAMSKETNPDTSFESQITLSGISGGCCSLMHLSAQNLKNITNPDLIELTRCCKRLTFISLNDCNTVSDTSLEIIAQNCASLISADFSQCQNVTLDGVWQVLDKCHQLKSLSLLSCKGLTNFTSFESTQDNETSGFNNSSNSELISQNVASSISDGIFRTKGQSMLQSINLAFCESLEPSSLITFSKKCNDLRNMILRFCEENMKIIGSDVLRHIFTNCFCLNTIPVRVSDVIDREMVRKYVEENGRYPEWREGSLI